MASYVYDPQSCELVPKDEYYANKWAAQANAVSDLPSPYIRSDIKPYQSHVTGKIVDGRAERREDLARSGCREVDPSEYKPIYRNYEFCQARRLPYMGDAIPPPMTRDEKEWVKERKLKAKPPAPPADPVKYERSKPNLAPILKDITKAKAGHPTFKRLTKEV